MSDPKDSFSHFKKDVCSYCEHNLSKCMTSPYVRKISRSTSVNITSAFFSYFGPECVRISTKQTN